MRSLPLTIGADPELFVKKGNRFISAHIFPCGSKMNPRKTEHGTVQIDGLAVEGNVRPATNANQFVMNVKGIIYDLQTIVSEKGKYRLESQPTVQFGKKYLSGLPRPVRQLGCEPDYSAYLKTMNPMPDEDLPIRTGAGHIHIGWGDGFSEESEGPHFEKCCNLAMQMDYYLGLPSLVWDKDTQRRELYGLPGAFRPKEYGMEYRVLSNSWTKDDRLMYFVFRNTRRAFLSTLGGKYIWEKLKSIPYMDTAREIILANDRTWHRRYKEIADEVSMNALFESYRRA